MFYKHEEVWGKEKVVTELFFDTVLRSWQFYNVSPERVLLLRFNKEEHTATWRKKVKQYLLDSCLCG